MDSHLQPSRRDQQVLRFPARTGRMSVLLLCVVSFSAQLVLTQESSRKVIVRSAPKVPALAARLHLIGKVKLEVVVSPSGLVTSATFLGGSPVFQQNAVEAVKVWKFERAEKETKETIDIEFKAN